MELIALILYLWMNLGINESSERDICARVSNISTLSRLHEQAIDGCAKAQYYLGTKYSSAYDDTPHRPMEGEKWLRMAIDNGNTDAMKSLSVMLLHGHHHHKINFEEGIELLEKAMSLGDDSATHSLATINLNGKYGLPVDYEKAIKLFHLYGYELDETLYYIAQSLFIDNKYRESKIWMERASLQGNKKAQEKMSNFDALVTQRKKTYATEQNNTGDLFDIVLGLIAVGVALDAFSGDSSDWRDDQRQRALDAESDRIRKQNANTQAIGWALVK